MRRHEKPVRKCHGCPLNRGDHCWLYHAPRDQWREARRCQARQDAAVAAAFADWQKQPCFKDRKALRREGHRRRPSRAAGEGLRWLRGQGKA